MAVAQIVFAWAILGLALSGVGFLASRALRIESGGLSLTFWLGWAATIGALNVWCLFLPVDGWASVAFGLVAVAGFALCRTERAEWLRRLRDQFAWVIALLVVSVWLADRARSAPQNGDDYLYHLHAIAWAVAFPAVPGLGNLHGRLAFNTSSTLLLALFDHGPLAQLTTHVTNGLLLLPLFGRGLRGVARMFRAATSRDALDAILLAPAVGWALGMDLSSASADLPVACVQAAIVSELAGAPIAAAVVFIGASLLTVKLSGLGFVLGLLVLQWSRRALIPAGIVVAAWMARSYILSGYPLYPSAIGGLPVSWRIPLAAVEEEAGYALAWGRRPGVPWREVLASHDWMGPWAKSMLLTNFDVLVPLALAFLFVAMLAIMRTRVALGSTIGFQQPAHPEPRATGPSYPPAHPEPGATDQFRIYHLAHPEPAQRAESKGWWCWHGQPFDTLALLAAQGEREGNSDPLLAAQGEREGNSDPLLAAQGERGGKFGTGQLLLAQGERVAKIQLLSRAQGERGGKFGTGQLLVAQGERVGENQITGQSPRVARSSLLLLVPVVAELIWWFFTSPDPRFAEGCIWLLPAIAAAVLVRSSATESARLAIPAAALLCTVCALASTKRLWGPEQAGFVTQRTSIANPHELPPGLIISVPESGSGCDANLLCTPFPNEHLRLRTSDKLRNGFKIVTSP